MTDATCTEHGLGLLEGVDVETGSSYSKTLTYSEDLLITPGFFWSAAEADARECGKSVLVYLQELIIRFESFNGSDFVFDRDHLKEGLRNLVQRKNTVSIVLGAKSIGKTKVLQLINKEFTADQGDVMVVYVNARDQASGSLGDGIQLSLNRLDKLKFFKDIDWTKLRENLADLVSLANKKYGKVAEKLNGLIDAMHLCGSVDAVEKADINFVHLIVALANQKKQRPCLIIDEANLCLNGGPNEDKIINQFLHFTKEDRKMNVILCSSKHSFPAQLERSGIQLGMVNLVQAEEPPPCAVWKFLTQEKNSEGHIIGMGTKLASLCMALAGGNVALIAKAVERLAERKEKFYGRMLLQSIEGAFRVKEVIGDPVDRAALEELARVGYTAPPEPTLSRLVEKSIAGLVTSDFTFFTKMDGVLTENEEGEVLVPSSSALRNRIALELQSPRSAGVADGSKFFPPARSV